MFRWDRDAQWAYAGKLQNEFDNRTSEGRFLRDEVICRPVASVSLEQNKSLLSSTAQSIGTG
jgi:hypothetical protein